MELRREDYTGDIHQKIITSQENGRKHIAYNTDGRYEVRHYKLDGNIIKNERCCDYLLVNDSCKHVYYIELKGRDISHAVEQIEAGEHLCRDFLKDYISFYRIVASKTRTHEIHSTKYRHFQQTIGTGRVDGIERLMTRTGMIEEIL